MADALADPLFGVPVVVVGFNRPDVTRRNLAVVQALRPAEVFLILDGPRSTHPEDQLRCAEVRRMVKDLSWPGRVHTRFAERNLGLEANIELGLDWVFDRVDRAIVVEDDCIGELSFFAYCEELLKRYADDPRVWQIAGDNKNVPTQLFEGHSYAFSTWASVWGWATWADRWQAHRAQFDRDHCGAEERVGQRPRTAPSQRTSPAIPHPDSLVTKAARKHFGVVAQEVNGDLRGWDHHWWVTIMSERGLSVTPALNLVENDGYGDDATHTRSAKAPVPSEPMPFPLAHPPHVQLDRAVEAALELDLLRTDGQWSRWARRLIRPLWLRAAVRRVMTFPPVWRLISRLVSR